MKRQITRINKQNAWTHSYENGAHVLVSYATPVACYIPGLGFMETDRKFSITTTKQIGQWKKRNNYPLVARVPQHEIEGWMNKLDMEKMQ